MTEVLPVTVAETARLGQEILAEVEQVIVGKPEAVRLVLLGVLASGHILIEDLPSSPACCWPTRSTGPRPRPRRHCWRRWPRARSAPTG